MDNQEQKPVEKVQEEKVEEPKEETVAEPVVTEGTPKTELPLKHGQVDPSFNCQPCVGEGLLDNGSVCTACSGTGKV